MTDYSDMAPGMDRIENRVRDIMQRFDQLNQIPQVKPDTRPEATESQDSVMGQGLESMRMAQKSMMIFEALLTLKRNIKR